jgi:small GTP-binding protein
VCELSHGITHQKEDHRARKKKFKKSREKENKHKVPLHNTQLSSFEPTHAQDQRKNERERERKKKEDQRRAMFSLIHGLCEWTFSKPEMRILIVGLDSSGKTSMLEKMKEMFSDLQPIPKEHIKPTVGLNVAKIENFLGVQWTFWDLGGLERLRPIWLKYYRESHGIFFLVDSTDETRIDEARVVCNRMLANTDLLNAPVLIVANKIDESGLEGLTMVKTAFESSALNSNSNDTNRADGTGTATAAAPTTSKNGILDSKKKKKKEDASAMPIAKRVMGASAFTGVGIKEAVEWMCNAVNGSERQRELDFV